MNWEVQTDAGWVPWRPGVPFVAVPHSSITFTMNGFPMRASFLTSESGIQVNTQTGRQRPLRRVKTSGAMPAADVQHEFQTWTFAEPTWCKRCNIFLWGLWDQGHRCRFCCEPRCGACLESLGHCPRVPQAFAPPPRIRTSSTLPAFATLHQAFEYCRPNKSGLITDKHRFAAVAAMLANDRADQDVVWSHLDQDGNGAVSFPEFVEWAEANDVDLPTGVGGGDLGVAFPRTWTGPRDDKTWNHRYNVTDRTLLTELQELLNVTYRRKVTRDRKSVGGVPQRYTLVRALRSENYNDWRGYYLKRHLIERQVKKDRSFTKYRPLTANASALCGARHRLRGYVNEWFLFHGTSATAAESIAKADFTMKLAGSATGTMYGAGTYLAESITKADEYAQEGGDGTCAVLVCRAIGGKVLYDDEANPDADSLQKLVLSEGYHCVLGDREKARGTFKEYVIFDADQIFVEYIVFYRREYS